MAVQAHRPADFLLLNRSDKEKKEMGDSSQAATGFLGQPAVLATGGAKGSPRKRERGSGGVPLVAAAATPALLQQQQQHSRPVKFISLQPQTCSSANVSLPQPQMHPASDDKQFSRSAEQSDLFVLSSSSPSLFSRELEAQINHQRNEIDRFLLAQGEQLRRELAEQRKSQLRALLSAAEEWAARRLREKEAEMERASRRRTELEEGIARLRIESIAWRAKAGADQSTVAALHAQLQQAAATAAAATRPRAEAAHCDAPPVDDAGSACVDPGRVERERTCRSCRQRRASAVLLPCRHLCLCDACDVAGGSCPICHCASTGIVRVFFS